MNPIKTEKYTVKNLDCANCAAKIESGLRKLAGVEDVSVDFAGQTLHVKGSGFDRIPEHVRKIEPDVELVPHHPYAAYEAADHQPTEYSLKRELTVLSAAFILFCVGLLSEDWLHRQSSGYLELLVTLTAYFLAGWPVVMGALRTIRGGAFFDENVLMVIATGGALAVHAYSEAVGVMIFYKVGEMLQELAVSRSRRSIRGLLAARPSMAFLQTTEGTREVPPESVNVGDVILVRPGGKVPLDGEVLEGTSVLDTSVLTGESMPVLAEPGDTVMAGTICKTGALTVEVTRPFSESSIAKVMDLVENATAKKARTEKFITTFARYYTPVMVLIAACIAFIPPVVMGESLQAWVYRALVVLVISCPCALVISIPLGYFGGIGRASRRGILVKGSNFIDALSAMKTVVFDKTGTLTKGVFQVTDIVNLNGFPKGRLLEFAAGAEYHSNHPIAASIVTAFERQGGKIDESKVSDHTDHSGRGVTAYYGNHKVLVGNDNFLHVRSIDHDRCEFDTTVVHIAVDGKHAGYITIGDEVKPDAAEAIRALKAQGVEHVALLTGDNACAAEAVAERLGLDSFHAGLFPENKVEVYESLCANSRNGGKTGFVGDGVNDAPVIARADVGVAMGALGSDAAIETADVVLMTDSPLKMAEAVAIAKLTRRIVWQNIILAFAVKGTFLVSGAMGLASMWEAVFADMGTALLAVANSTRILGRRAADQSLPEGLR